MINDRRDRVFNDRFRFGSQRRGGIWISYMGILLVWHDMVGIIFLAFFAYHSFFDI